MKKNLGTSDRLIRTLTALVLAVLYASGVVIGQWGILIIAIAVILLLTAVAGICPLYSLLGINTCKITKI